VPPWPFIREAGVLRNWLLLVVLLLGLLPVFTSCGVSDVDNKKPVEYAPEVRKVWWALEDRTHEPCPGLQATAMVTFFVYLEDADQHSDISSVKITSPGGGSWTLDSVGVREWWNAEDKRFEIWNCVNAQHIHSVALGSHTIEVEQPGKQPSLLSFKVFGRRDASLDSGFIYSYADSSYPKILRPAFNCFCCVQGETLSVSFDADDAVVEGGFVWYYDSYDLFIGRSSPFYYMGGVISIGHNDYKIDISDVRPYLDHVRIALYWGESWDPGGSICRSETTLCRGCVSGPTSQGADGSSLFRGPSPDRPSSNWGKHQTQYGVKPVRHYTKSSAESALP
jgi:hypothetical protein